jgi:GTP-binding protein
MALEIEYLKSAVNPPDFPKADRPEVALAGRSNAGKSSFLNAISKKPVARVSQEPGKTRLLNFFDVGKSYRLVDMPGYGWAKRSINEMESWTRMIEGYLEARETLAGLVLLMDIKREWTDSEELLAQFLRDRLIPFCVVLTKADKLSASEVEKRVRDLRKETGYESIFAVSNLRKKGTEEVEEFIYKTWIQPLRNKKK